MVKHHHFPDIAVEILEKLDKAGMSSEDSDGEPGTGTGTGRTFRIKRLPWRSSELTEWLHRIDNMPTKNANGAVLAKMAVYRNRISSDIESQARSPVHRLPRRFYRAEWMRLQSKRAVKEFAVSGVDVSLPKIDEFLPVSILIKLGDALTVLTFNSLEITTKDCGLFLKSKLFSTIRM